MWKKRAPRQIAYVSMLFSVFVVVKNDASGFAGFLYLYHAFRNDFVKSQGQGRISDAFVDYRDDVRLKHAHTLSRVRNACARIK